MEKKQILLNELSKDYNITVTKKELAKILSCSISFIDKCIMLGQNIPNFKKLGSSKNAKVIFTLPDIVEFLTATKKIYHF